MQRRWASPCADQRCGCRRPAPSTSPTCRGSSTRGLGATPRRTSTRASLPNRGSPPRGSAARTDSSTSARRRRSSRCRAAWSAGSSARRAPPAPARATSRATISCARWPASHPSRSLSRAARGAATPLGPGCTTPRTRAQGGTTPPVAASSRTTGTSTLARLTRLRSNP